MPVKPTKAMVLAAGLGLRMRPLTERMPKPMVPVAGKPLLDHVLDKLAERASAKRSLTCAIFRIRSSIMSRTASVRAIIISDERNEVLGTGGAVVKALPLLGDDAVLPSQCRHHVDRRCAFQSDADDGSFRSLAHGHSAADGADREQHRL